MQRRYLLVDRLYLLGTEDSYLLTVVATLLQDDRHEPWPGYCPIETLVAEGEVCVDGDNPLFNAFDGLAKYIGHRSDQLRVREQ